MNRRVLRTIVATTMTLVSSASFMSAAVASTGDEAVNGTWHRYHQPDFTVDAGDGCDFEVQGTVMYDREYYRNLSRYDNGQVRVALFRGPLIIQYTNTENGTKVLRNQSGVATEKFNRDGSFASIKTISGHFGAVVPENSNLERGVYTIGGQGSAYFVNVDGSVTVKLGEDGTAQNLCPILARKHHAA